MTRLPIIGEGTTLRRSRTSKWRAAVLIAVHLLIALHITHWLITGRSITPVEPSEAMAFTRSGIVNAGAIFFAVSVLSTLVLGRLFCGWACHLVALQDLSRWLLGKVGIRPRPLRSRVLAWVPFVAFAYMFLWPMLYRFWIGESFGQIEFELTTAHFWQTFPGWTMGALTFFVCGFLIVYLLGSKGFCTYACPYGAAFSLADRVAPLRVRVTDACAGSGHCTATCTSNVRVHEEVREFGMVVSTDCLKCLDCVSVCPTQALFYGFGPSRRQAVTAAAGPIRSPALPWTEELILGSVFATGLLTLRGLYGVMPFLLSLGLSAVLAYLLLTVTRLFWRPNLALRSMRLKSRGHLLPAGVVFLALMSVLAILWAHSGLMRYHQVRGVGSFRDTSTLRRNALDLDASAVSLTNEDTASIRSALHHLEAVDRLGLIPTPGNATRRAWLYYLAGSPAHLEEAVRSGIERGEHLDELQLLLGLEAVRTGDAEAARFHFGLAIEVNPQRQELYLLHGLLEAGAGDFTAAEEVFQRALHLIPTSPELLYNLGLAQALQGKTREAIDSFEQALHLDPEHIPARENLAGLLATSGLLAESEIHYREAIELSPNDAQTRYLLARVLAARGDFAASLRQVERALQLKPDLREAIILRAEIEARRQQ